MSYITSRRLILILIGLGRTIPVYDNDLELDLDCNDCLGRCFIAHIPPVDPQSVMILQTIFTYFFTFSGFPAGVLVVTVERDNAINRSNSKSIHKKSFSHFLHLPLHSRLTNPQPIEGGMMFAIATLGLFVNLSLMNILHSDILGDSFMGHGHSHSCGGHAHASHAHGHEENEHDGHDHGHGHKEHDGHDHGHGHKEHAENKGCGGHDHGHGHGHDDAHGHEHDHGKSSSA